MQKRVEKMTIDEKILNALKSATKYFEDSVLAFNKGDENLLADSIWHGMAELEYVLFLFSITLPTESNFKWKPNPELKKMETVPVLFEAKKLLNEAEGYIVNEKLQDAYKSVYVARHYMLTVQESLAKKKREALKRK